MLLALEIKDFALIDELKVNFYQGLNILTGETGAGKSIIIDAVSMVIGERADRNFVRSGADKSIIQGIFSLDNIGRLKPILEELGIDIDNHNMLIITREIYANGRSISRVNGIVVTQTILKSISQHLIDIHGQHQHQFLLNPGHHIDMLDAYGGEQILNLLNKFSKKYSRLQLLKNDLSSICFDEMERERQIDLIKFQINEIEMANLQKNEEEELIRQRNILANSERIYQTLMDSYEILHSENLSVLGGLTSVTFNMQKIGQFDEELLQYSQVLEEIQYRTEDLVRDIRNYIDQVDFDPKSLENVELRLDLINMLKRKYGKTIGEILQYKSKLQDQMWEFENSEEKIEKLRKEIDLCRNQLKEIALELSLLRQKAAKEFEKKLTDILLSLNMGQVEFKVEFKNKLGDPSHMEFTSKGIDSIEFVISTNLGQPLKPLAKIISGGEMSRIMLAFKTILAHIDSTPTLIFDEIDTGISGRTAQVIGQRLFEISSNHQVICITHLPQIAAMANHHYLIEKNEKTNKVETSLIKLDKKDRVKELGRLLGGGLTEITLKHAKEMIEQADFKKAPKNL